MKNFRLEHIGSLFVAAAGVITSILYFTGSRYLDAKAQRFGFVADINDASLQKTLVIGASVLGDVRILIGLLAYLAVLVFSVWFVLLLARLDSSPWNVKRIRSASESMKEEAHNLKEKVNAMKQMDAEAIDQAELDELERSVDAAGQESADLLRRTKNARRVLVVPYFFFVVGLSVLLPILVSIGRVKGNEDAADLILEANGPCVHCLEFVSSKGSFTGVAVLQSKDLIVILTKQGVVSFPLQSLAAVKPAVRPVKAAVQAKPGPKGQSSVPVNTSVSR